MAEFAVDIQSSCKEIKTLNAKIIARSKDKVDANLIENQKLLKSHLTMAIKALNDCLYDWDRRFKL